MREYDLYGDKPESINVLIAQRQAQEWSQKHDTDGESPDDYEPRCCSCHQKYDDHWNAELRAKVSNSVKQTWVNDPSRRQFSEEHRSRLRAAWARRKAREAGDAQCP